MNARMGIRGRRTVIHAFVTTVLGRALRLFALMSVKKRVAASLSTIPAAAIGHAFRRMRTLLPVLELAHLIIHRRQHAPAKMGNVRQLQMRTARKAKPPTMAAIPVLV